MQRELPEILTGIGAGAVTGAYDRRKQFLKRAAKLQEVINLLQSGTDITAGTDSVAVIQVINKVDASEIILDELRKISAVVAGLASRSVVVPAEMKDSSEEEKPRRSGIGVDSPEVDFETDVIDLLEVLKDGRREAAIIDPGTLRSLADLDDEDIVLMPQNENHDVRTEQVPEAVVTSRTIHGIEIPVVSAGQGFNLLGVDCPADESEWVEKIINDAHESMRAGKYTAPVGGHYRYRWRRTLWLAAQEAMRAANTSISTEKAAPTLKELPPSQEMRIIIAALLKEKFPKGITIAELRETLKDEYDVRKSPNYWWLLMAEGPFHFDDEHSRWSLAA